MQYEVLLRANLCSTQQVSILNSYQVYTYIQEYFSNLASRLAKYTNKCQNLYAIFSKINVIIMASNQTCLQLIFLNTVDKYFVRGNQPLLCRLYLQLYVRDRYPAYPSDVKIEQSPASSDLILAALYYYDLFLT